MKSLSSSKWIALIIVVICQGAMGSANTSKPAEEIGACANSILHGAYQWNASGYIQTTNTNGGNITDFAPLVEASYAVFDGHGKITKLVSMDGRNGEAADFVNTDPGIIIAGTMKKRD